MSTNTSLPQDNPNLERVCKKCGVPKPSTNEYYPIIKAKGKPPRFDTWCKACRAEWQSEYRRTHPDRVKATEARRAEKKHEYYLANREHFLAQQREYRLANPDKVRLVQRRWCRANRERHCARIMAYNARKRGAHGRYTAEDVKRQYDYQNGKCWHCFKKLKGKYEVDHIVALARGGSNSPDNICCACLSCNRSKGSKTLNEWGRLF